MQKLIKKNISFFVCLLILFVVRGSFADQNVVPSGSMEPTIHVGDHIFVNKMAYDLHAPYSKKILYHVGEPQRGDIVVFHNPITDVRMVKRLIGLPGDHLEICDGFVWVNGHAETGFDTGSGAFAAGAPDEIVYEDFVGDHVATIKRTHQLFRPDSTSLVVPPGHYFTMGDNRDNSYDSRGWGVIPRENLEGRAVGVIYNLAWNPMPSAELGRVGLAFR